MSLFPKTMSLLKILSLTTVAITALQRATFRPITVFKTVFKTVSINNTMIAKEISIISILSIYIIPGKIILSVTFSLRLKRDITSLKHHLCFVTLFSQMRNSIKASQAKILAVI